MSQEEMLLTVSQYEHDEILRELNVQTHTINSSPFSEAKEREKGLNEITRAINRENDWFYGRCK